MINAENDHITFMFTDIEGSTRLWEEYDRDMEPVMSLHDKIVHSAIEGVGGSVFKHTGDGVAAAFPRPRDAARAALLAQHQLGGADWGPIGELRARVGIHYGRAQHRATEFFGRDVNRCARIMDAAHGGQVLVSGPTADLFGAEDNDDWSLRDLGVHQLKDLSTPERVFQLCHPDLTAGFPSLRTVDRIPRKLPAMGELFVGREDDVRSVRNLLRSGRLIVMTGPGGVGKTQLAVACALDSIRQFPDGIWFCSLANVATAEEFAQLIETTMGLEITDGSDTLQRVITGLASRRALIILDGVEQALSEFRHVIATLLERCQNATFICTSREVLRSRGEQVFAVGPLIVPDIDDCDASEARQNASVSLFERRARLANSAFELTAENLPAVISICRQLDGLPLAVDLAAAQMATFDPQVLADRIGRRVGLIDDKDQSLGTIIDWSYESLSEQERLLFQHLAVFAGGFSLSLAERVCSDDKIELEDVMPGLADLVDKSVISIERTPDGNRYSMLEILRSYAMGKLTDVTEAEQRRQRHLDAYLEFLEKARTGLTTRSEAEWVKRISSDFANIRAAYAWAIESGQIARALELIHYIDGFARDRFRREIDPWAEETLKAANGDEVYLFAAQAILASAAARAGDMGKAVEFSDAAVNSARSSTATNAFMPYQQFAISGIFSGDYERTKLAADEAIERATQEKRPIEIARFHIFKAHAAALAGDQDGAKAFSRTALQQARELRNPSLLAWSLYAAGAHETDESHALALLEESIEFADMVGNRYIAGNALQVASWQRRSGSKDEIASGFSRVINHWYRVANWTNLNSALRMCAATMQEYNDELIATINGWLGTVDNQIAFGGIPDDKYASIIAGVVERLGEQAYQAAADRGATMDTAQLVRYSTEALEKQVPAP